MIDIENFPTNETAKEMMETVSPIYDKAYVGKWIFQIMGFAMELAKDAILGMENELFPENATSRSLALWEEMYGILTNPALSDDERRKAILMKRNYRKPMNPARIASMVSDITSREVYVRENTDAYTFEVCILQGESEADLNKIREQLEIVQQAKIINIVFESASSVNIRVDPLKAKIEYKMTSPLLKTGTTPDISVPARIVNVPVDISPEETRQTFPYVMSGTVPDPANVGVMERSFVNTEGAGNRYGVVYKICGQERL